MTYLKGTKIPEINEQPLHHLTSPFKTNALRIGLLTTPLWTNHKVQATTCPQQGFSVKLLEQTCNKLFSCSQSNQHSMLLGIWLLDALTAEHHYYKHWHSGLTSKAIKHHFQCQINDIGAPAVLQRGGLYLHQQGPGGFCPDAG